VIGHISGKFPEEKVKMAMAVHGKNRHYRWARITREHWLRTGELCGLHTGSIENILSELVQNMPRVLDKIIEDIPVGFPSSVAEPVLKGVEKAATALSK
jgi:serine/threonine-protein kinase HipA